MSNYIQRVRENLKKHIDVEPELFDLYVLLVFTRGHQTTWEDVHDAWSIWQNNSNPEHKSIVPFDVLSEEVQKMDEEYADAIKLTAEIINPRDITF